MQDGICLSRNAMWAELGESLSSQCRSSQEVYAVFEHPRASSS